MSLSPAALAAPTVQTSSEKLTFLEKTKSALMARREILVRRKELYDSTLREAPTYNVTPHPALAQQSSKIGQQIETNQQQLASIQLLLNRDVAVFGPKNLSDLKLQEQVLINRKRLYQAALGFSGYPPLVAEQNSVIEQEIKANRQQQASTQVLIKLHVAVFGHLT